MTPGTHQTQLHAVQDLIANAILAAQAMDSAKSEDLRALLTLAAHEAGRITVASAKKPVKAKAAKDAPSEKRTSKKIETKKTAQPIADKAGTAAKTRAKKSASLNGAAH